MIDINLITNVLLMLCITLLTLFAFMYLLKRFKKIIPQGEGALNIISGAQLGTKSKVVLVQAKNKQILLGVTDSQIQTLYVFTPEETVKEVKNV